VTQVDHLYPVDLATVKHFFEIPDGQDDDLSFLTIETLQMGG